MEHDLEKLDVADHVQFRARFPWLSVMKRDEQYSDKEAQRRFLAAVKAGLNTKPKPLKSISPKGPGAIKEATG